MKNPGPGGPVKAFVHHAGLRQRLRVLRRRAKPILDSTDVPTGEIGIRVAEFAKRIAGDQFAEYVTLKMFVVALDAAEGNGIPWVDAMETVLGRELLREEIARGQKTDGQHVNLDAFDSRLSGTEAPPGDGDGNAGHPEEGEHSGTGGSDLTQEQEASPGNDTQGRDPGSVGEGTQTTAG